MTQNSLAFVDLLGTSEFAQNERTRFQQSLVTFKETVESGASLLASTDSVYFFSDCLYLETDAPERAIAFLRYLRRHMLLQGFYMKGALGYGTLDVLSPSGVGAGARQGHSRDQNEAPPTGPTIRGHSFRGDVVEIYALQDALKGIGIRVAETLVPNLDHSFLVQSCHLPYPNSRVAECFSDLRFSAFDLDEESIQFLLRDFVMAATRSKRYGRYYLSVLISIIRSSQYSGLAASPRTDEEVFGDHFVEILLTKDFERNFGTLPGIEQVYFALLDELYHQSQKKMIEWLDPVQDFLARRRRYISHLETVPSCIFGRASRNRFLQFVSQSIRISPKTESGRTQW